MGGVVAFPTVPQTRCTIVGRGKITACEQPPGADAKPQRHVMEPGPLLGREVEDRRRGRIAQERAALHAALQGFGAVGDVAPVGDEPADLPAPVGMEIVHHPIIALQRRQLLHDMGEMGGPISTGAGLPEMPPQLARWDDEGGQECARTMADVLVFTLFRCARLPGWGRVRALENLPPGLFVGTAHEAPVLRETERVHRALTDIGCFGGKIGIVAMQPVHTPMWREGGLLQNPPHTGATHGPQARLDVCSDQIVETPAGGWTMRGGRFLGRSGQDIHPLSGGKSAAADPSAAPLADR